MNPTEDTEADVRGEAPPSLRALRILLVDDEPESREVVAELLGRYGADVTLAGSAEEALTLFSRVRPHVLVSDISMPDRDGYSLLREIRGFSKAEGGLTPAVALTAAAASDDRLRALRAGFQYHLPKPVKPVELAQAIASLAAAGGRPV